MEQPSDLDRAAPPIHDRPRSRWGREPFDIDGVGRIAILNDPVGAAIAWMTPLAVMRVGV